MFGKLFRKNQTDGHLRYISNITRCVTIMLDLAILILLLNYIGKAYIAIIDFFGIIPWKAIYKNQSGISLNATELTQIKWLYGVILIEYLLQIVLIFIYITFIWYKFGTTPGKFLFGIRIVNKDNLQKITFKQASIRFFGLIISILPLTLGIIWSMFDKKSQSWHDKLANTLVIVKKTPY